MDLELDDEAFVRAPPAFVYRRLTDFSTYPAWWPGFRIVRATPAAGAGDGEATWAGEPEPGESAGWPSRPGPSRLTFELRTQWRRRPLKVTARP